jgi:hypothetical protein
MFLKIYYIKNSAINGVKEVLCIEVEAFGILCGILPVNDSYSSTVKGEKQCEK